jgi:hypothetical protein
MKLIPSARLTSDGSIVSMDDETSLPNYSGLVYADFDGRPYILWAHPLQGDGTRDWDVINAGAVVVQTALDKFIKEAQK